MTNFPFITGSTIRKIVPKKTNSSLQTAYFVLHNSGHCSFGSISFNNTSKALGVALLVSGMLFIASCGSDDAIVDPGSEPDAAVEPTFSIELSESSMEVVQGESGTVTVSVTRTGGFTGAVDLSLEDAPDGVTVTFDPTTVPAGENESTLVLETAAETPAGESELVIQAQGEGVGNATVALDLLIKETGVIEGDYSIMLEPVSLSLEQGEAGEITIQLQRDEFDGEVVLSVNDLPDGVTVNIEPKVVTGDEAAMSIDVGTDTVPGSYTLTVTGHAEDLSDRAAELELTVAEMDSGDYSITLEPVSLSLEQGETGEITIQLQRDEFDGEVALSVNSLPDGVTVNIEPEVVTGDEAAMTIDVGTDTAPGSYMLTVTGLVEDLSDRTAEMELTVTEMDPGDYSIKLGAFTAEVNGRAFDTSNSVAILADPAAQGITLTAGGHGDTFVSIAIYPFHGPGRYTLDRHESASWVKLDGSHAPTEAFTTNNNGEGIVEVTTYSDQEMAGTFQFTSMNNNDSELIVQEGQFRSPLLQDADVIVEHVCGEVYRVVEDMPELIGGMQGIHDRLVYPAGARETSIEGQVVIEFTVGPHGEVISPVTVQSPSDDMSEEAIRLLLTSSFRPGFQRGRAVCVQYALPITFRL